MKFFNVSKIDKNGGEIIINFSLVKSIELYEGPQSEDEYFKGVLLLTANYTAVGQESFCIFDHGEFKKALGIVDL